MVAGSTVRAITHEKKSVNLNPKPPPSKGKQMKKRNSHLHNSILPIRIDKLTRIPHRGTRPLTNPRNKANLKRRPTLQVLTHGRIAAGGDHLCGAVGGMVSHRYASAVETARVGGGVGHVLRPAQGGGTEGVTPAVDGGKHVGLSFIEWRSGGGEEEETEGGGWEGDHGCECSLMT